MKRLSLAVLVLTCACATGGGGQAPSRGGQAPSPVLPAVTASPNRLTPVASMTRTIKEPRIRVGLLSDQSDVSFARIAGGYYIVSDAGASILKRGFTANPPLANAQLRYAVQVSAISDQTSVNNLVEKLKADTNQPVDAIFDPAAGIYRIIAGDFPDQQSASSLRSDLQQRGY